jgi:MFS family permease
VGYEPKPPVWLLFSRQPSLTRNCTTGFFVLGQALTKTTTGLIACRFFMGMCEAGFVPGCAYLIGSYYTRNEFLRRYAVFFSANMAAGAFNGVRLDLVSSFLVFSLSPSPPFLLLLLLLLSLFTSIKKIMVIRGSDSESSFSLPYYKNWTDMMVIKLGNGKALLALDWVSPIS